MSSLAKKDFLDDPLDNVEIAASIQNWTFDRSDNEVSIIANGKYNNYQLSVFCYLFVLLIHNLHYT